MYTPDSDLHVLETLLSKRLHSKGEVRDSIDRDIHAQFSVEGVVLFSDLSGFSQRTQDYGILHFLELIFASRRLLAPLIKRHDGTILKTEGDSLLALFPQPRAALDCAIAMQRACHAFNREATPESHILLCLGLSYGSYLRIGNEDVFGVPVNAASFLGEDLAGPGDILVDDAFLRALNTADNAYQFAPLPQDIPPHEGVHRTIY